MRESNPINHSVCRWCYDDIPLEEFCTAAKEIGIGSIELLETSDFATLRKRVEAVGVTREHPPTLRTLPHRPPRHRPPAPPEPPAEKLRALR